jgi:hypothetical protein
MARASRTPIPAKTLHSVNLRDQRKCQYPLIRAEKTHTNADEKVTEKPRSLGIPAPLCGQTRFLEIRHLVPLSEGGSHTVQNLITLCSHHHEWIHSRIVRQPDKSRTGGGLENMAPGQHE